MKALHGLSKQAAMRQLAQLPEAAEETRRQRYRARRRPRKEALPIQAVVMCAGALLLVCYSGWDSGWISSSDRLLHLSLSSPRADKAASSRRRLSENVSDTDILTSMNFDKTGEYLAVGDKGGRVIVFRYTNLKNSRYFDYRYFSEI